MDSPIKTQAPTIFFDDECLVCNGFVHFLLDHDRDRGSFRFAGLQSAAGQAIAPAIKAQVGDQETIALLENGRVYTQSTALLKILKQLGGPWKLFYPLIFVPSRFRDFFYDLFSKNRYRLGKVERHCLLLQPHQRKYFEEFK